MIKLALLAVGGITGTISRYALAGFVYGVFGARFPYGTLIVNVLGCFIIGFLAAMTEEKFLLSPNLRILLMVGFCGAFTTFSTFILETSNLIRDGETLRAFINILLSVSVGFIVFRIGFFLADLI
ncbi:MAG: fluoride efflux transporter CrcB [Candidatus Omnitrophica bacterium]|nr:fluoride efflux transporter CrcB [Candidatus Omnitrophota bacterium]